MRFLLIAMLAFGAFTTTATAQDPATRRAAVVERGKRLELPGTWQAPPGLALHHQTAGFAKTLCSAVFITGLDPADAAANVGFFTGPLSERRFVVDTVVDRARQEVRLTLSDGVTRVARRFGSQGCIALPIGADSVFFTPSRVTPNLPDAATTPWPMGDAMPLLRHRLGDRTVYAPDSWPAEVDSVRFAEAMTAGFGPDSAMTLAFLVTYKGRILGERYAPGIGIHTPLESWSMGKSLTGTLIGRLIQMGVYRLDQPAPIPEWQQPGDPRQAIRIQDLMQMSSGLRIRAPQDPDYDPTLGYPDHLYLYTGGVDSYHYAATRDQQWPAATVGRYRNSDPVLAGYLVRLGAERLGHDYHAFPQRQLFDKLGMRDVTIETDPYGNFMAQGYEFLSARDWARLANLYLRDGVWNGERLLPEGYVTHVKTVAPAWQADGRLIYGGGFFWVNGDGGDPLPHDAFSMQGAGGQSATVIPSHDMVIVRLGKYRGERAGDAALRRAQALLMQAVRPSTPAGAVSGWR